MIGKRRPCVRCGRTRLAHDLVPLDRCLSYVEPSPPWLRTLVTALSSLNGIIRRFGS